MTEPMKKAYYSMAVVTHFDGVKADWSTIYKETMAYYQELRAKSNLHFAIVMDEKMNDDEARSNNAVVATLVFRSREDMEAFIPFLPNTLSEPLEQVDLTKPSVPDLAEYPAAKPTVH